MKADFACHKFSEFVGLSSSSQKARRWHPVRQKAARSVLGTNNGNNGNGCNQKRGRENLHRDKPDATEIARDAKNACGVDDNMTTKVAAVGGRI